jgi:divalent metal cation (Fe/Co/Zn/Cd) transporter
MKVAKERKSSVLASNAVHHRVDSWTGIVTLVVIALANFVQNATWLDPVGGLMISILVVKAGAENTVSSIQELVDRGIDEDVKKSVSRQVRKRLDTISQGHQVELRDVSGIKSGQNYLVDLEMGVPGAWTVEDLREVEEGVREQIGNKVRGAKRVRVRFVSSAAAPAGEFDEFISADISPRSSPEPEEEHNHNDDHHHSNGNGKKHR